MGLTNKQDASVVVTFTVYENGNISDVTVSQSSGIPTLDHCAIAAVKESAPFGKLPLTFADKKLEPTVTLYYVKKQE
jgi:TonB family protein